MKPRIAFIIPILAPYRISFYSKIVELNPDLDFLFFHGLSNDTARPSFKGKVSFTTESYHLQQISLGPFGLYLNKGLIRKVKTYKPNVIILYGNPGVISNQLLVRWAKLNGIKICLWICSWDSQNAQGIFRRVKTVLTKKYFTKADHFIAYSSHAGKYIESLIGNTCNVSIAYNGLDINESLNRYEKIVEEARKLRNSLPDSSFLFLYVGGLIPTKNPMLLISAFKKLQKTHKNIYLWIIGDGVEKEKIENEARSNTDIKYWGRIVDGVDKYFKAADCFVLPGSGGLALNQAMFWKTPCISSFADGTEEDLVFENVTGYRFKTNDEESLIIKMEKMIMNDAATLKKMGAASRKLIINQSNTDAMLKTFNSVISELLSS